MKAPVSRELAVTRSDANRMVRISSPCAVPNPVRSTDLYCRNFEFKSKV
jgi:hypothetical protein